MPDRYGDEPDWPVVPLPATPPDEIWAAEQRRNAVVDCGLCDDDGYRGSTVCDHVDRTEVAQRGIAAVRARMGWKQ